MRKISENEDKELITHFVVASDSYYHREYRLTSSLLQGLKKYKIHSVMVTIIHMHRNNLITTEEATNYFKGREYQQVSVNDDLESLFDDLRIGKEVIDVRNITKELDIMKDLDIIKDSFGTPFYFLPKLTTNELKLIERKDPILYETFQSSNPDVDEAKMKLSDSESKFVRGSGYRKTFKITNYA